MENVTLPLPGMGGTCEIGTNGDKVPYFWIYQFVGEDRKAVIVAESEDRNTVCIRNRMSG